MDAKRTKRIRRHKRIRRKVLGQPHCPRLCVYRGLSGLSAQLIDDINKKTLISISTEDKQFKKKTPYGGNVQAAKLLGVIFAERAKNKKIKKVIFDRAGFLFHGRIKAFAESCREQGLEF